MKIAKNEGATTCQCGKTDLVMHGFCIHCGTPFDFEDEEKEPMKYYEAQKLYEEVNERMELDGLNFPSAWDVEEKANKELREALEVLARATPVSIGPILVINCTPHPIRFGLKPYCQCPVCNDGTVEDAPGGPYCNACAAETVEVQPSEITLTATPTESPYGELPGIEFVKTEFVPSEDGRKDLAALRKKYRESDVLIVGSIISAQAYAGQVVSMIPVAGFERVPPAEKRMRSDKFNVFSSATSTSSEERELLEKLVDQLALGDVPFGTVGHIKRVLSRS